MLKVIGVFILLYSHPSFAQKKLSVEELFSSITKHHPEIDMALKNIDMADGKVMEKRGGFDTKLGYQSNNRTQGYYDGEINDVSLTQPLGLMNAELFAGFRNSSGEFPVYEEQYRTLSDGEQYLGVRLSLLRDMLIDGRRLDLRNSLLEREIAEEKRNLKMNSLFYVGEVTYWEAVKRVGELSLYQELLNVSLELQSALQRRAKSGDLAQIYLEENRQYILQRRASVVSSSQGLVNTIQFLSLFLRDEDGNTKEVSEQLLPEVIYDHLKDIPPEEEAPPFIESAMPGLALIDREIRQADNNLFFSKSNLLPKLNLYALSAKDRGEGLVNLQGREFKIGLDFSFPLQIRKARGQLRANEAKKSILLSKRRLFLDKVRVQYQQLQVQLKALKRQIEIVEEEVKIAKKLRKAEEERFLSGHSDFFVINLRDQNIISSKIKYLDSVLKYHRVMAKLKSLTNTF